QWRKRVEALGARELDILLLEVAYAHVVEARISEHTRQRVLALDALGPAADDYAQLALVIHPLVTTRPYDRQPGGHQGGGRLEKEERLVRGIPVHLFGVCAVIPTDPDDFGRQAGHQQRQAGDRDRTGRGDRTLPRLAIEGIGDVAFDAGVTRNATFEKAD